MAKKKRSVLPNLEVLIVLVLIASFVIMAAMRCNKTKKSYEATTPSSQSATPKTTKDTIKQVSPKPTTKATPLIEPTIVSRLYVTLENLNVRTGPSLDSTILTKLALFEEVYFLNEVTDFKQKISLGPEVADEPWIKIRSKRGHIGWVYGAGVNYYKRRRLKQPKIEVVPPTNGQ